MERTKLILNENIDKIINDINELEIEIKESKEFNDNEKAVRQTIGISEKILRFLVFEIGSFVFATLGFIPFSLYDNAWWILSIFCIPLGMSSACGIVMAIDYEKNISIVNNFKNQKRNILGWKKIALNLEKLQKWANKIDFTYVINNKIDNEKINFNIFVVNDGEVIDTITFFLNDNDKYFFKNMLETKGTIDLSFIDKNFLDNTIKYYI